MLIAEYFKLTERQAEQFAQLDALYRDWNSKINVISRKDIDNLYEHHVLHSLAIAKLLPFQPGSSIMDVGTGGGFPGIPLAILFPECQFLLIDSIGKKIKVASEVAQALGLTNVVCRQERVEEEKEKFDFDRYYNSMFINVKCKFDKELKKYVYYFPWNPQTQIDKMEAAGVEYTVSNDAEKKKITLKERDSVCGNE